MPHPRALHCQLIWPATDSTRRAPRERERARNTSTQHHPSSAAHLKLLWKKDLKNKQKNVYSYPLIFHLGCFAVIFHNLCSMKQLCLLPSKRKRSYAIAISTSGIIKVKRGLHQGFGLTWLAWYTPIYMAAMAHPFQMRQWVQTGCTMWAVVERLFLWSGQWHTQTAWVKAILKTSPLAYCSFGLAS